MHLTSGSWKSVVSVTLLVTAALYAAGCRAGGGAASVGTIGRHDPRETAVTFIRSLYSGHFRAAQALVLPTDRGMFAAFAEGITPASLGASGVEGELVKESGAQADVRISGLLCSTGTKRPLPPGALGQASGEARQYCTRYAPPSATKTYPVIRVVEDPTQRWWISF